MDVRGLATLLPGFTIQIITPKQYDDVYQLQLHNEAYQQLCSDRAFTMEECMQGILERPDAVSLEHKCFIGIYQGDHIVAILDFLLDFPQQDTCMLGLFMVDRELQGQHLGTRIIQAFYAFIKAYAKYIRIGVLEANVNALSFWKKHGFYQVDKKVMTDEHHPDWTVLVMMKEL